jgi:probable rRNA maturation factor
MRIYWNEAPLPNALQALLTRALSASAAYANAPDACEVSVSFVGLDEIRGLNRDYRNKDEETDVLSFPGFLGSPALGDIVICSEAAERQAREYGHTFERELTFLAVHGLLHLLGYDHMTPEDEEEMCAAQDSIMQAIGVQR